MITDDTKINKKEIAVLVATYNGEKYLAEQLDSLHQQSLQEFRCYIHDDGSSDGTVQIIRDYCNRYPEHFVEVKGPVQGGAKDNFLYLLRNVEADYYMFCDQDDYWFPNKIETSLNELVQLEKGKKGVCVFSDLKVVDSGLIVINDSFFKYCSLNPKKIQINNLLSHNVAPGCTMMFDRLVRNKTLELLQSKEIFIHDWMVMLIASLFGNIKFIEQPLMLYRQHDKNQIGADARKSLMEKLLIFKKFKSFVEESAYYIQRGRKIAGELCELRGLSSKKRMFLESLSIIDTKKKTYRILFYWKYHLFNFSNVFSVSLMAQLIAV